MKQFLRKGAMLLSILILSLSIAACSRQTGASSDSIKIGISQYIQHGALDLALEGFLDRLEEKGYEEGKNLILDIQNAQGENSNTHTIASKFAADKKDLILAIATPSAQALANQIKDVPIVVTAVTDPADAGLVDSNEKPGANITGTSDLNPVKEQVELLKLLVPDVKTVGIMYASSEANSVLQGKLVADELDKHQIKHELYTVAHSNDLQSVIESSVGKVDAWYIPTDNMFASSMGIVRQVATAANMPVIIGEENMMNEGAHATVALDYYKLGQMTADMAIDILENGTDPASMPIQYQEDPIVYINDDFAAEIGLEIPDEVRNE